MVYLADTLLEIGDLKVHLQVPEPLVRAVDGMRLTIGKGEAVGLRGVWVREECKRTLNS